MFFFAQKEVLMQKNNWIDDFTQIVERFYNRDLMVSDVTKYQLEAIVDGVKRKRSPESRYQLEVNGIKNAEKKDKISNSLYLGKTIRGKKVYFTTKFNRLSIECSSTVNLEKIAHNLDGFIFDNGIGRARSFEGQLPTRRKGNGNFTDITLAYLISFNHICKYKKVGHVNGIPSRELTRELMYLTMPDVETGSASSFYGITSQAVIDGWNLPSDENYSRYKEYFNLLVKSELIEMKKRRDKKTRYFGENVA